MYFQVGLRKTGVLFVEGDQPVGKAYPETARFNAVVSKKYLIHHLKITDKGIFNTLTKNRLSVMYVKPQQILLSGFPHGFIGGCLGRNKNHVFVIGA